MKTPSDLPSEIDQWFHFLTTQSLSHNTIAAYRRGLLHFADWYGHLYEAPFHASEVMPRDVRDWKSHQQTTERSAPATINQRLAALNAFFNWTQEKGLCPSNPAAQLRSIRLDPRQPQALKGTQLRRLLKAAHSNRRDYAMIELLAGTGLRVGEHLALRFGDIQLRDRSGKVVVRAAKGSQYREVPLSADVRAALERYLDGLRPPLTEPQQPLWQGRSGDLSNRSSVKRMLDKYARAAGIELLSPHVLRHTFATRYLQSNPDDLRGLARLLGHSNLNTVMIYTEPDMDDLTARIERMQQASA